MRRIFLLFVCLRWQIPVSGVSGWEQSCKACDIIKSADGFQLVFETCNVTGVGEVEVRLNQTMIASFKNGLSKYSSEVIQISEHSITIKRCLPELHAILFYHDDVACIKCEERGRTSDIKLVPNANVDLAVSAVTTPNKKRNQQVGQQQPLDKPEKTWVYLCVVGVILLISVVSLALCYISWKKHLKQQQSAPMGFCSYLISGYWARCRSRQSRSPSDAAIQQSVSLNVCED
ncbi:uncharacterized protein LOC117528489 isoform X2 [Thalassophryne amazonica]|uniref:uncharacterized protein LOC117528489 isoform X2 n=1 Tax=Thalassophryne amazonica TaxID=390379 RepID=UPI001470C52A|nr:uncharacterized protein LOC117528489 isoform X2 [Thalassophryne amazonica]